MKKLCFLLLISPLLIGCNKVIPKAEPTSAERICRNLNRNLTFDTTSSLDMDPATPTERAEMMRLYNKYECSKFETKQ